MTRVHDFQPSFNSGEFSPRLAARLDFVKHKSGLKKCENLILLPEGGAMRRGGSRYVAGIKSDSVKERLKRFQFSVTQAYALELGEKIMRFYRHQGQITVADTTAAVTNGTFPTNITDWDDRSTGGGSIAHDATNLDMDLVPGGTASTDIGWGEQDITTGSTGTEHVIKFRVVGDPGDKIEFQVGTAASGAQTLAAVEKETGYHCVAFTPTTSPFYIGFRNVGSNANKTISVDDISIIDNAPVEIDTPWAEADLYTIEGPQSADVLYQFHTSYPTHKLQRFGHTTWSLVEVAWTDGPYLDENSTTTTLIPSAATGVAINLTLSSIKGINNDLGWQSTDVGRLVRYKKTTIYGWAVIVSITSTTVAVAHVKKSFEATPTAVTTFSLGAWSGTTGYPQVASFFEQRLYVAATTDQPQTLWGSQTADFENHTPDDFSGTIEDDDALNFTLSADDVNAIRWFSAGGDTLVIGTDGGEWVPTASGIVITPLDITIKRQTTKKAAQVPPVRVDGTVLFVQKGLRKIREFVFSFEVDSYVSPNITRTAQHITTGGIIELDYAEEPDSLIWAVRNDGQLLSLTYRREEDTVGWGRHILGGSFQGGNAVVESVVTIPGANGSGQFQDSTGRDEVLIIVKRTINGTTKRFIEFLEKDYETEDAQEDAYYVDSMITLDSPVTITGATAASPVVITAPAHGFSDADEVRHTDVKGMTELNTNTYKVANKTANTYELTSPDDDSNIDGTAFTAYISGGKANKKVTAISGLDHLEGETVRILADGAIAPNQTVSSGTITLDSAASVVQIGLGYTHKLETLKISAGNPAGTPLGKIKRIYGLVFALLNSHTLSFGKDSSNLDSIDFRVVTDPMDAAAPLFTGERFVPFPGQWDRDVRIVIESDPVPFTLLALAPEINLNTMK
ncbi:hypothetical protein LCGC14_1329460 [marine sediment metagenome]|uniref:Ubiquitin-activating enzyme E1 FCCH domain-containing protein n=1 Tax=marine sediment metagenome TaxID=412755 RepID=A0A0F9KHQ4_9ZZZZ